jgi:hypothetical protein
MTEDAVLRNPVSLLQKANQFRQRLHLLCRWCCVIEIPDEADSDAVLVGPVARRSSSVGAGNLLLPATSPSPLSVPLPMRKS